MPRPASQLVAVIAALCLGGCASVPNVALDKSKRAPIKTLALLRVSEPQNFMIRDFSGMAGLGGLVGGAVQGSIDGERGKKFVQLINDRKIRLGETMAKDLVAAFAPAGVTVTYLSTTSPVLAADKKSDDYSHIVTNADAILVVWFGAIGFVNTAKLSTEYQPWLLVTVRLVDPATKATLYQKTYDAGYATMISNVESVPLDSYKFGGFDDLMARSTVAVEALTSGEELVARRAANDLK